MSAMKTRSISSKIVDKHQIILVWGPPGCGKSTHCKRICELYGFIHINFLEIVAKNVNTEEWEAGSVLEQYLDDLKMSTANVVKCFEQEMTAQLSTVEDGKRAVYVIDGFPRGFINFQNLIEYLKSKWKLVFVINFYCGREASYFRLLYREGPYDTSNKIDKRIEIYYTHTAESYKAFQEDNELAKDKVQVYSINAEFSEVPIFQQILGIFQKSIIVENLKP